MKNVVDLKRELFLLRRIFNMAGHVKKPKTKEPIKVVPATEFDSEAGLDSSYGEETLKTDCVAIAISPLKNGKYEILKVAVDSVTKRAGETTVIDTASSKMEANEKFKINVVKLGII